MKSVVIVGGGFTGILTAVNIIRLSTGAASGVHTKAEPRLKITILSKGGLPCRGVAYSTLNSSHLLNVVARNMSALADQPTHFLEWLAARSEYLHIPLPVLREQFVPRRVFGDYLHNLFFWYTGSIAADKGITVEVVPQDAVDITSDHSGVATVHLAGGGTIEADKAIMALGNQPPGEIRIPGLDASDARYIANPWTGWESLLPSPEKNVLIIGTGLTMVDTVLSLQDIGWKGKIYAISRNGLLPLSHFKGVEYPDYITGDEADTSLRGLFHIFAAKLREARATGINPAILIDKLRPYTQRLWQGFSLAEKRQFSRRFRTRWNITRHRIAPSIHQQLMGAISEGKLEVLKARILQADPNGENIELKLQCGEQGREKLTIEAGSILNCTGPKESCLAKDTRSVGAMPDVPNPARALLRNLAARGTVISDEMEMGLSVGPDFGVKDMYGNISQTIYATGTLLKGTLWESSAVPELRSQTFRLAEMLVRELDMDRDPLAEPRISEALQDVIEYWI
ncbi:MAG: FAD/NAD(P)-binding protein [Candidatus Methylacidiphilales bacterium]